MPKDILLKELEQIVIDFAERRQYGYEKDTVKNLFIKKNKKGEYDKRSFVGILKKQAPQKKEKVDQYVYEEAVRLTVKGYTSSKASAIDLMKRWTADIEKKVGVKFEVKYPPIPADNTFERLMYISKYLQNPENKISDLSDELWISSRTIDDDILKLRGMDSDPIQICGRKYVLDDIKREKGHIRDMASTPHPFFLTCNITQIIVMMQGLKEMSEQAAFKGHAMKTAYEIWEQLSDMARNRILYVATHLIPDLEEWFRTLNDMGENTFWTERVCSSYGDNAVLECLKNGSLCYIEYSGENGKELLEGVQIKQYCGDTVKVVINGEERELVLDNIIRSATKPELLV